LRKGSKGDRINAVLAEVGYNVSPLRRWLTALLFSLALMLIGYGPSPRHA
jgi:hypothetical protein